jgi:glycosyltransferase involved in cell wall biosynthesis
VAATHSVNALIARKARRLLGYQFIVLAHRRAPPSGQELMSLTRATPKVVVVMPAYNAGRTLRLTYEELPKDTVNLVILVDDGSTDATLDVARQLGLEIFVHNRNYGYGANQKTCYAEALRAGADVVVMVHPDYQYDPRLVPQIIDPIVKGGADVVLGSRLKEGSALAQGMPWWKYLANRFLTGLENRVFSLSLSEYHTGYRAFTREVLETVNFPANSDGFVFDQEIIAQVVAARSGSPRSRCRRATSPTPRRRASSPRSATVFGSCPSSSGSP